MKLKAVSTFAAIWILIVLVQFGSSLEASIRLPILRSPRQSEAEVQQEGQQEQQKLDDQQPKIQKPEEQIDENKLDNQQPVPKENDQKVDDQSSGPEVPKLEDQTHLDQEITKSDTEIVKPRPIAPVIDQSLLDKTLESPQNPLVDHPGLELTKSPNPNTSRLGPEPNQVPETAFPPDIPISNNTSFPQPGKDNPESEAQILPGGKDATKEIKSNPYQQVPEPPPGIQPPPYNAAKDSAYLEGRSFGGYPSSSGGYGSPSGGYVSPSGGYDSPSRGYFSSFEGNPSSGEGYPTPSGDYPTSSGDYPTSSGDYPTSSKGYPTSSRGYPTSSGGYPTSSRGHPTSSGGYSTSSGAYPTSSGGYPTSNGGYPTSSGGYTSSSGSYPSSGSGGGNSLSVGDKPSAGGGYPVSTGGYPVSTGGYPSHKQRYGAELLPQTQYEPKSQSEWAWGSAANNNYGNSETWSSIYRGRNKGYGKSKKYGRKSKKNKGNVLGRELTSRRQDQETQGNHGISNSGRDEFQNYNQNQGQWKMADELDFDEAFALGSNYQENVNSPRSLAHSNDFEDFELFAPHKENLEGLRDENTQNNESGGWAEF